MGLLDWAISKATGRPARLGKVKLDGALKGVCHAIHCGRTKEPARRLLWLMERAGVQIVRGPEIEPWILDNSEALGRLEFQRNLLLLKHIQPVVGILPGLGEEIRYEHVWAEYVSRVVSMWPCSYYSIGNEPDNHEIWFPIGKYAEWLNVAASVIRRERPQAQIVAPELGHGRVLSCRGTLRSLMPNAYDILAVHPYDKGWGYVNECMEIVPEKTVWITEDGSRSFWRHAHMRGTYAEYARHERIGAIFWYAAFDPGEAMQGWNLLKPDATTHFEPKAEYHTFREI